MAPLRQTVRFASSIRKTDPTGLKMAFKISDLERIRDRFKRNLSSTLKELELRDPGGDLTNAAIEDYAFLATAAFLLNDDVDTFRDYSSTSGKMRVDLFERVNRGQTVFEGHVDFSTFPSMLYALAAGDWETTKVLAVHYCNLVRVTDLGTYDCPYDAEFCAVLSSLISKNFDEARDHLHSFRQIQGDMQMYCGYSSLFDFLLGIESAFEIDQILKRVEHSYAVECQEGGMFEDTVEELLSVWGVGLANLALRMQPTVQINYDSQLIPRRLLHLQ